jgi:hypothetical protein
MVCAVPRLWVGLKVAREAPDASVRQAVIYRGTGVIMSTFKMLALAGTFSFACAAAASAQAMAVDLAKRNAMVAVPAGSEVVTTVIQRTKGRPVYAFEFREPNDPVTHMVYIDTATGKIVPPEALGLPSTGPHSVAKSKAAAKRLQSRQKKLERCEADHPHDKGRCREKYGNR